MDFRNRVATLLRKVYKTINEEPGKKSDDVRAEQDKIIAAEEIKNDTITSVDQSDIKIADDVLFITASQAALEVDGVVGMSGDLSDDVAKLMGKEKAAKGVKISSEGRKLNVTVYLEVEYGVNLPELALNVQARIKRNIQDLTGYEVQYVDVHIENVVKAEERQSTLMEDKNEHNG